MRERPRFRWNWPLAVLGALMVAATGIRLFVLTTPITRLDGDEGVTGVMAQRILDGDLPMYFGAQSYQGALEQYLQAVVLLALPDNPFTLRLVQVLLVAATLWATFAIARRVTGSPWGGVLAAGLIAIGPYYFLWKSVKSHGGYDAAMLAGLVMTLAALALRQASGRIRLTAAGVGLAAGVAIWENPTSLYMVIPAALWALGSARGMLGRVLPWGIAGLVVGISPMLVHILRTGVILPTGTEAQPATTFLTRLGNFFDPVLPEFLGVSGTVTGPDPGMPARAIAVIALILVVGASWHRRRGLWDLVRLRQATRRPIDLILLGLLCTPVLYALSPFTWFTGEPRYIFTLYPFAAIAAAAGLLAIPPGPFRMAATVTVLITATFLPSTALARALTGPGTIVATRSGAFYSEDLPAVAAVLRAEGAHTAYTNVWAAGPLQFATGGSVLVSSGYWTHFPEIARQVRRSRDPAIVVPTDPGARAVRSALQRTGRVFRETPAGRFTVFAAVQPPWHPPLTGFVFIPG